ncbi:hypothetical protein KJ612_07025 [Myxococcota bacterium]|nr:hypothetical protein [Myxococcota bacterium]MBU1413539.1 hypothetical protein [Myxococcota bacterium]
MDQDQPAPADQQLIRWLRAEMARATGKRYQVQLELLDATSLRDLQRLLRDLDHEKQMAVRNARLLPWK